MPPVWPRATGGHSDRPWVAAESALRPRSVHQRHTEQLAQLCGIDNYALEGSISVLMTPTVSAGRPGPDSVPIRSACYSGGKTTSALVTTPGDSSK